MDFNKDCKLFLKDLYYYDITSCHYQILQKLGIDTTDIPADDKIQRNVMIGKMIRSNPRLGSSLRSITVSTIDDYIAQNNIKDEDIILRQYDGFISKKQLSYTNFGLSLDLHHYFVYMIISFDRKWYIALDSNNQIIVKGIPHKYDGIVTIYKKLLNLNYSNRKSIFVGLDKIRELVLNSDDPKLYCIPTSNNDYNVYLKDYGEVELSEGMVGIMDTEDIDREKYFNYYIRPFSETITTEFI